MVDIPARIAALILEEPLCIPCIAMKATVSETDVEIALARIESVIVIRREVLARCRACGRTGIVVSLSRPYPL